MPNKEFEKQLQQKMNEFTLTPSASVWQEVEQQINKKRRKPYLLPVLLMIAACLAGTFYFIPQKENRKKTSPISVTTNNKIAQQHTFTFPKTVLQQKETTEKIKPAPTAAPLFYNNNTTILQQENHQQEKIFLPTEDVEIVSTKNTEVLLVSNETIHIAPQPRPIITISPVENTSPSATTDTTKHIDKKWEAGIHIATGMSGMKNGVFKAGDAYPAMYSPGGVQNSNSTNPSELKQGPTYTIGILARKQLGVRSFLSIGMNYNYLSNYLNVGPWINSPVSVNASSRYAKEVPSYYLTTGIASGANEDINYKNNYQFIEMPVTFELQLLKKLPLSLNAGLAPGFLIHSNALHYDKQYGIYYQDNNLFNKVRLNITSQVNYRIWQNKNISIQAGPFINYNASHFLKKEISGSTHPYSAGFAVQLFLLKK